jgi:hypothetical protein
MMREHCLAQDSNDFFVSKNYGIRTCPEIEWNWVIDPHHGLDRIAHIQDDGKPVTEWPKEKIKREGQTSRKQVPLTEFHDAMTQRNHELHEIGELPLIEEELIGLRLYTGPMGYPYNTALRNALRKEHEDLHLASAARRSVRASMEPESARYVTTIHVVNGAVVKLSKITVSSNLVYRGITQATLPESFTAPNTFGKCGGCEPGFLACTTDKMTAHQYAGEEGLLFQIHLTTVDRGADISFISQFPFEKEVLFSPLTLLEVQDFSTYGAYKVLEMSARVSDVGTTIETQIARMQKAHLALIDLIIEDMYFCGAPSNAMHAFELLKMDAEQRSPEWYNHPENFKNATAEVIDVKHDCLRRLGERDDWEQELGGKLSKTIRMQRLAEKCAAGHTASDATLRTLPALPHSPPHTPHVFSASSRVLCEPRAGARWITSLTCRCASSACRWSTRLSR